MHHAFVQRSVSDRRKCRAVAPSPGISSVIVITISAVVGTVNRLQHTGVRGGQRVPDPFRKFVFLLVRGSVVVDCDVTRNEDRNRRAVRVNH